MDLQEIITEKRNGTASVNFSGATREYDVVDRKAFENASPRYFIGYNQGRPFISEEVPEEFRPYMVIHELAEFEVLKGQTDSCLNALKTELGRVPCRHILAYLPFRRNVFSELIIYLEKNQPKSPLLAEVRKSLNHLEKRLKQIKQ